MQSKVKRTLKSIAYILAIVAMLTLIFMHVQMNSFNIEKIDDYMYSITCSDYSYFLGNKVVEYDIVSAGCSTVRSGNFVGRNLDWKYDDSAEFLVKTPGGEGKYASIGIASLTEISKETAEKELFTPVYYFLPFFTVDGINEKGVFACMNEIPGTDCGYTSGTNPGGEKLCVALIVRYVLDYAESVDDAIEKIKDMDIYSYTMDGEPYEMHIMIADEKKTAVVEFINNKMVVSYDHNIMTNYYLNTGGYTPHAEGIERYNILYGHYGSAYDEESMMSLMRMVNYSNLYNKDTDPVWYSEMYGQYTNDKGEEFLYGSNPESFGNLFEKESAGYNKKERDGKFWQTCHTSVYNIKKGTLSLSCQEKTDIYNFSVTSANAHELLKESNQTSSKVIIPINCVCVFVLLVILYGLIFQDDGVTSPKSRCFTIIVILSIFAVVADTFAWMFDGMASMVLLQTVANYFSMIMGGVLSCAFIIYEHLHLREKTTLPKWPLYVAAGVEGAIIFILTIGTFLGLTFYFVDGVYYAGDLYFLSVAICLADLVVVFVRLYKYRKVLPEKDISAFVIYGIIPLGLTLYEFINSNLELGFVGATFSALFVYILLQVGKADEMKLRHEILADLSNTDQLTGLNNRRSFDDTVEKITDGNVGVIFCDVNRLKFANDTYGHKEGDKLLVQFADIMRSRFTKSEIFRISGDEFVIIVKGIDEITFNEKSQDFKDVVFDNNEIASVGCEFGEGKDVVSIISKAEILMYENKAKFYDRHPQYERRSQNKNSNI